VKHAKLFIFLGHKEVSLKIKFINITNQKK